jgi:uncharacterized SAM-binding protein YcdF (DUF218 family)
MSDDQFLLLSKFLPALALPLSLALGLAAFGLVLLAVGALRTGGALALIAFSLLWAASTPQVAARMAAGLENRYPAMVIDSVPQADVIVVLGGGLRPPIETRLDLELASAGDRLWYAARLYRAGRAPSILVSGGNVFDDPRIEPEAIYAAALLRNWGVEPAAIGTEARSRNTLENARLSAGWLREDRAERVLLVTSALHMPRAMERFRAEGFDPIPAPTDFRAPAPQRPLALDWIPSADALALTTAVVHEWLGILAYRLRDRLEAPR